MNQFYVTPPEFDFSPTGGLQGLMGGSKEPQQPPNPFASQTPGAPQQPGRIDATSFGEQGGETDLIQMLMQNIAKSFGGA